jgi:EpsD family peptidyl-prolyl cis-trans isomerase
MRFYITLFFLVSFIGLAGCSKDRVVAEFRGGKITLNDLEKELEALPPAVKTRYSSPQGKREFLEQLVQQRLILNKAHEEGIDRDPEILQIVESHKRNLIQNKIMQKIATKSVDITEDDIRKYYDTNIKEFTYPERYCLKRLSVKERTKGMQILGELKKNKIKFEDAVSKYSEDPLSKTRGGDIGCIQANQRPDVPQEVFKLKKGALSGLIEFNNYFHIYLVRDILPQQTQTYDNAKEGIRMRLANMKRREMYESFIKELKENADVRIYPEILAEEGGKKEGAQQPEHK